MVNFMLTITAKLVNLTNLQPQGGIDDPNFSYYFKMKCNHCGEISKKATCVNLDEIILFPTRRSFTNLVQTCKLCERVGSVKLIPGYGRPLSIECGQYEIYKPLMVFDCKGLEPVDFIFGNGWRADSTDGTKFYWIDLTRGEYSDYDKDGQFPIKVLNLRAKFDVVNIDILGRIRFVAECEG